MRASKSGFILLGGLAAMCLASAAPAQTAATQPAGQGSLLQQLSRETTDLYQQTSGCIVRVQLPRPPSVLDALGMLNNPNNPLARWMPRMDPSVRQLFPDLPGMNDSGMNLVPNPANPNSNAGASANNTKGDATKPPANAKPNAAPTSQPSLGAVVIRQGNSPFPVLVLPDSMSPSAPALSTNTLGIVFDDRGDVMVPMFVDHELGTSQPIIAVMSDGQSVKATYVGSDHATRLTVIHLEHFDQRPAVVAQQAPENGSLVMLVTLDSTRSRLAVWGGPTSASTSNGGASTVTTTVDAVGPNVITTTSSTTADEAAVVDVDGSVAGLTLRGRYLPLAPFAPIVKQIVDTGGFKHRAVLGVFAMPIDGDDPARAAIAALGTRPALRVQHVNADSPADRAGIQVGDMILTIAGQPTGIPEALAAIVGTRQGQTPMELIRDGRQITIVASLEIAQ